MTEPTASTFHWSEAHATFADLTARTSLRREGRVFVGEGVTIEPPVVLPIDDAVRTAADYIVTLPDTLDSHLVLLLQAGAASIGWFEDGDSVRTKSIKKYVVRGRGKAQPTHLQTKGKSRYGSRLRLQNARKLLIEVNERLGEWVEELGPPAFVFYSCPVRSWPEVFRTDPPPPFEQDLAIRIPYDLPVPTTDVMLRTYRRMSYGRVEID